MIPWDTETCGFHGMPVLLQYAIDYGPSVLHELWYEKLDRSMEVCEEIVFGDSVVFNGAFDIFHLYKFWCTAQLVIQELGTNNVSPKDHIDLFGVLEEKARDYPKTWRLKNVVDLMLVAQRTKYQSMIDRKEIRIRRVPYVLAEKLIVELNKRIVFAPIYFARRKKPGPIWRMAEVKNDVGDIIPDLVDIVCSFKPSKALKALAVEAGLVAVDDVLSFTDIDVGVKPEECGYAPYAAGTFSDGPKPSPNDWRGTWPDVIDIHIEHWHTNKMARKYAALDPEYTRGIYDHFGQPQFNDVDSQLANMVAVSRWRGYAVDVAAIRKLKEAAIERKFSAPTAPRAVKNYIYPHLAPEQIAVIDGSTKKTVLETIAKWDGPAGECATKVLTARSAAKEIELYDKMIQAGRFHASFKVIGAKSNRMSGSDGLNPQGIKATKEVRGSFPLALPGMQLDGGDFDAFEVAIAEAVYGDEGLRKALTEGIECPDCFGVGCDFCKEKGTIIAKIHALFAQELFPELTYRQIMESKGKEKDYYTDGKRGLFALFYGGNEQTLVERIGVEEQVALAAILNFASRFPGIQRFQDSIREKFCSMTQPGGIGSKVIWQDPAEYVESMFGFRRYFDLENKVCRELFNLSENLPEEWKSMRLKVVRRDREQKVGSAIMSALFAAAFNIQGQNMRAAANHLIQSPGADMTKRLQCRLWNVQPVGISDWCVQPLNVHDELMTPCTNNVSSVCAEIVKDFIEEYRKHIPLLDMTWQTNIPSWAGKK